uniref:Uncharacterized protein n=1 Tax=Populus trichocarpa TaxID=3694 RepID=A0A2K2A0V0_POPTR
MTKYGLVYHSLVRRHIIQCPFCSLLSFLTNHSSSRKNNRSERIHVEFHTFKISNNKHLPLPSIGQTINK